MITFFTICVGLLGLALLPSVAMAQSAFEIRIEATKTVGEGVVTQIQFDVFLNQPIFGALDSVEVDFNTVGGTAIEGTDYQPAGGRLRWDIATPLTNKITVDIDNDMLVEDDEIFTIVLSNEAINVPNTASIQNGTGTATINSEDVYNISIADAVAVTEGGVASFTVSVSPQVQAGDTVTVQYSTLETGTAKSADGDFTPVTNALLTFNEGDSPLTAVVTTLNDGGVEIQETFPVQLNTPTTTTGITGLGTDTGTGTINSDDPYDISIAKSADVAEGNPASFTVTITPAVVTGDTVTVEYTTVDGDALAGSDYTAMSGTLTFKTGELIHDIMVPTTNDSLVEFDENFSAQLGPATTFADLNFGVITGSCNIQSDDKYEIVIDDIVVNENVGNAIFTVSVSPAIQTDPGHTVTVGYTTNDGVPGAVAPGDYTTTFGTLTFTASETSHTISVPINDDTLVEFEEIFVMDLTNSLPSEITNIADPQGDCNILIDELYEIAV
jgi:hypothetical protein